MGSGPLVLLVEAALDIGPTPSMEQRMWLFEMVAAVILGGLAASLALLWEHGQELDKPAGLIASAWGRRSLRRYLSITSLWGPGLPARSTRHDAQRRAESIVADLLDAQQRREDATGAGLAMSVTHTGSCPASSCGC